MRRPERLEHKLRNMGTCYWYASLMLCILFTQFTFSVIVKQVLGLSQDEPQTAKILEDFLTFMKGLISFPLYIPGTSYAKAVQVCLLCFLSCLVSRVISSPFVHSNSMFTG